MKVNSVLTGLPQHCMTLAKLFFPVQKEHQFQQQKLLIVKDDSEEIWRYYDFSASTFQPLVSYDLFYSDSVLTPLLFICLETNLNRENAGFLFSDKRGCIRQSSTVIKTVWRKWCILTSDSSRPQAPSPTRGD